MNTTTYNPAVQVRFTTLDSREFAIAFPLSEVPFSLPMPEVVDALQADGVYRHPLHVCVGDNEGGWSVGTLSVTLV